MSDHLASALTSALETLDLKQHEFAEKSGLSRIQVNRACRGSATTGREVIGKLVRALPEPHNTRVLAAWLRDEAPDDLRSLVLITPAADSLVFDEASGMVREAPPVYGGLDKRRTALLEWVRKQIIGTEFCDMLEKLRVALEAR